MSKENAFIHNLLAFAMAIDSALKYPEAAVVVVVVVVVVPDGRLRAETAEEAAAEAAACGAYSTSTSLLARWRLTLRGRPTFLMDEVGEDAADDAEEEAEEEAAEETEEEEEEEAELRVRLNSIAMGEGSSGMQRYG